ncbi:hypothetical protein PPTG_23596 [Phytophthora nicotianae INRA-310]|uniref:RxLR effector protein n=1 Tax=Phytophthora nicotianae (strain INRA-310) TaxID=761204 RepID=W2PWA3_PHYN3|nr:hypothetical protein PPTG_23596 [Phytophthora nicotianae INRA-310]ETN04270.1 hypothetical protein PPTG_23596 [Phytophthora nicotianae INRA-310]
MNSRTNLFLFTTSFYLVLKLKAVHLMTPSPISGHLTEL